MDGETGNDTIDPFACCRLDLHRLRRIQFVKNRRQTTLRKALHPQVAVVSDSANHESRLVDGCDDKTVWRTGSDCYDYVAEVVCFGVKTRNLRTNCFSELVFIAGNTGNLHEFIQVLRRFRAWLLRHLQF